MIPLDNTTRDGPSICVGRTDFDGMRAVLLRHGFTEVRGNGVASRIFASETTRLWLIEDLATGTLSVTSEAGAPLPDWLPRPSLDDIHCKLSSTDPRDRLAGLQMATGRDDGMLPELIAPLVRDPEPQVVWAALRWLADHEGAANRIDPAAAVFSLDGLRREKLQMMRWWMQDRPEHPEKVAPALARALADADWEIAATAMLAAASLGLGNLAPAFRRMALPEGRKDGVTRDEARLVIALRDAGLARLGHGSFDRLPSGVAEVFDGDSTALPLALQHFAAALSGPLALGTPPPAARGLTVSSTGIATPDGRPLAWVPPGAYRLGIAGAHGGARYNPPRIHAAAEGFFIDAHPREPATFEIARTEARRLSETLGMKVCLPDPDMWEMAMRGTDGRRFPWGLALHARSDCTPFGLTNLFEGAGEWIDFKHESMALLSGGPDHIVPALHREVKKQGLCGYRLTFRLTFVL